MKEQPPGNLNLIHPVHNRALLWPRFSIDLAFINLINGIAIGGIARVEIARRDRPLAHGMASRILAQGLGFRTLWPIAAVALIVLAVPAAAAPEGATAVAQADTAKPGAKKAKAEAKPKAESKAKIDAKAKPEAQAKPDAKAKVEAKPNSKPDKAKQAAKKPLPKRASATTFSRRAFCPCQTWRRARRRRPPLRRLPRA